MRAGVTSIITFICCFLAIVTVMTIGSFNLQRDELERAMDFTIKQTARQCLAEDIKDTDQIDLIAIKAFNSQINSKKGTLTFYVLHADTDIIDLAATFTYTQYNGTEKMITCRKTYIKDWEVGKEEDVEYRFINLKYYTAASNNGGLKDNSVWKGSSLYSILNNKMKNTGEWETYQSVRTLKQEVKG